jgi:hypothetical protein
MTTNRTSAACLLASLWAAGSAAFVLLSNFLCPQSRTCCDYLVSFYVAGSMVLSCRACEIYPTLDCASWKDSLFNSLVHQILPALPGGVIANFMYPPAVALILAPFAALPAAQALCVWQAFNLALLVLSARWLSRGCNGAGLYSCFVFSMIFAPVFAALWVGQTSIILGLAPLCAAAYYSLKERPYLAGLLLSILVLKPQFVVFILPAALLLPAARKTVVGLLLGLGGLTIMNASALTWPTFLLWLHSLQLSERFLGAQGYSMAGYLAASLPAAVLLLLPPEMRSPLHLIIYCLGLALAVLILFLLLRPSLAAGYANIKASRRLAIALWSGSLAAVLCAPRLVLYDISLFVPALALLWFDPQSGRPGKMIATLTIQAVDLYVVLCLIWSPSPLILVLVLICSGIASLRWLCRSCPEQGAKLPGQSCDT